MGFGEVPSALESGVIDGLMTSIGGWLSVREQAPYYTTGGAGVFTGDYYMVSASRRWWDRLPPATQQALEKLVAETIQVQKEYNWCVDKLTYEKYGTKDPVQAGRVLDDAAGSRDADRRARRRPGQVDEEQDAAAGQPWVDTFAAEGRELSKQNPPGSSWIEKIDCSKHADKIVIR